jgi:hypothetical protein
MRLTLITGTVWGCALDLECHHLIEGVLERQTYFEISRPIYTEGPAGWQGTHVYTSRSGNVARMELAKKEGLRACKHAKPFHLGLTAYDKKAVLRGWAEMHGS